MVKKKFYLSAPQDDLAFLEDLKKTHADDVRKMPSRERLIEITRAEGVDVATGVFYLSVFADPVSGPFNKKLETFSLSPAVGPVKGKILIIPAMFYEEYPEVGGHAPHINHIARKCGFDTELVKTRSPGSFADNIESIYEAVKKDSSDNIWLMSLSRGSLEVRLAIEKYGHEFPFHKVKGWINTCGFPSGNSLTDINVENWKGKIRWWLICKIMRCNYDDMKLMGEEAHAGRALPHLPPSLKIINIVPFAREWHVQTSLIGRFKVLTRYGPNDGITTTRSSIIEGYPTIPLWAADHFFRNDKVVPMLYRLFQMIGEDASI